MKPIAPLVLLTGILTGITYGSFTIALRYASQFNEALTVATYSFVFGTVLMFPFANVSHAIKLVSQKPSLILWTIGLGLTCSVIANTVFTYGISKIEAGTASFLAASEPLTATLVGIFIFNDSTNTQKAGV